MLCILLSPYRPSRASDMYTMQVEARPALQKIKNKKY